MQRSTLQASGIEMFTASATLPGSRNFAGQQSTVGQPEFGNLGIVDNRCLLVELFKGAQLMGAWEEIVGCSLMERPQLLRMQELRIFRVYLINCT
jgi:hypothetical protein